MTPGPAGRLPLDQPCPDCGGRSTATLAPCQTCGGTGRTPITDWIEYYAPARPDEDDIIEPVPVNDHREWDDDGIRNPFAG